MKTMNEKSYTELAKLNGIKRNKEKEMYMKNLYIDMLLSEIQWNAEKDHLMTLIDQAIDERNKQNFYTLSKEFQLLCKRFGN